MQQHFYANRGTALTPASLYRYLGAISLNQDLVNAALTLAVNSDSSYLSDKLGETS